MQQNNLARVLRIWWYVHQPAVLGGDGVQGVNPEILSAVLAQLLPALDERQRRLVLGALAAVAGSGGATMVARAAGVSRATVAAGGRELDEGVTWSDRVRRPGGGRKRAVERDPRILDALAGLMAPAGEGWSPVRWTTRSTYQLAEALRVEGLDASPTLVGRLLREQGYTLRFSPGGGRRRAEIDHRFRALSALVGDATARSEPVVIVEVRGAAGGLGVRAGADGLGAAFAGCALRLWWESVGSGLHPGARRLLACVDAGVAEEAENVWQSRLTGAGGIGLEIRTAIIPPVTCRWETIRTASFTMMGDQLESRRLNLGLVASAPPAAP